MSTILELRNKRANLWEQTKAFLEDHRGADGLVAADAVETYEKMVRDVQAYGVEIDRMEQLEALDKQFGQPTSNPVYPTTDRKPESTRPTATKKYADAFWAMMRGNMSREVFDALSIGGGDPAGSAGGFTVPDEFERTLVEALDENNVFRRIAHVIKTGSGTRTIPVAMDSGEASWVEEGAQITESDMSFSKAILSAYKMATMVKASNELLNDSAFDLAGYIAKRFGVRFGNAEENAFLNGTGPSADPSVASRPTGILTQLSTAAVTTADYNVITFDDVYKLFYGLKSPYRPKATFLAHDTVMLHLMTLKDGNSTYIWKPSLEIGKADTLLGHPIYTSAYMPGLTGTKATDKGKKVMLFGDFDYFWIGDRGARTVKRLNELFAVNDQTGFIGTQRVDGKLVLDEAIQFMKLGGS